MYVNENFKNKVKIIGGKRRRKSSRFTYKISHILAVMYPRPIIMVPN